MPPSIGFDRVLRMRHQAENVEALVGDARDRAHRAVGIRRVALAPVAIDVAQDHLPALFHLRAVRLQARRTVPRHA